MRVFLTGATGFIGTAIAQDLLAAGHQVVGLVRSDDGADKLERAGVTAHRGELSDIGSLATGAASCDGVIHTAFIHDFVDFAAAGATDRRAIEAIGAALARSGRPLVVTSGLAHLTPGHVGTEDDAPDRTAAASHRIPSEDATLALAQHGVRASVIRLPPSVHGDGDYGFVPRIVRIAREKGVSAYVGDGQNRWPAVYRLDAARLFRLALERGVAGSRYHGVGDSGVAVGDIARAISQGLNLPLVSLSPAEAVDHFGFLAGFLGLDCPASSAKTQTELGWHPTGPGLLTDLRDGTYFS